MLADYDAHCAGHSAQYLCDPSWLSLTAENLSNAEMIFVGTPDVMELGRAV